MASGYPYSRCGTTSSPALMASMNSGTGNGRPSFQGKVGESVNGSPIKLNILRRRGSLVVEGERGREKAAYFVQLPGEMMPINSFSGDSG